MDRRQFLKNAAVTATGLGAGAAFVGPSPRATADNGRPVRPPGALEEDDFLAQCIRCMRCIDACPNQAIVPLDDSFGRTARATPAIKPK